MTLDERYAVAREMVAIVRSRIPEDEQAERAVLIGEEFALDAREALLQWCMARVAEEPWELPS